MMMLAAALAFVVPLPTSGCDAIKLPYPWVLEDRHWLLPHGKPQFHSPDPGTEDVISYCVRNDGYVYATVLLNWRE